MNPIILLALGGVALVALRKKPKAVGNGNGRPNGNGGEPEVGGACASMGPFYHEGKISGWLVDDGYGGCIVQCEPGYAPSPDGTACIPVEEIDHVVDEGQIESAGGVIYDYRVWRMYSIAVPYVGELLLDDVWTSGPMGASEAETRDGLQTMADSFDLPEVGFQSQPADPCAGALPGPFEWLAYNEAAEQWEPINDLLDPMAPLNGYVWCVTPVEGNAYESLLLDPQTQQIVYASGPVDDPHVAASMVWYASFSPEGPFPWVKFQLQPGG